ncbi:MAG: SpoIIE family protein phosphatase [Planctomycetota bacterium]
MGLAARFALGVSLALAIVLLTAGQFLAKRSHELVQYHVDQSMVLAAEEQAIGSELLEQGKEHLRPTSDTSTVKAGGVLRTEVQLLEGRHKGLAGARYAVEGSPGLVLPKVASREERDLGYLIWFVTGVAILVGAGVASLIARHVARPLDDLVQDVRVIARGNLRHRPHVKGPGEVRALAKAIDKMGESLAEAQHSEVELGIRMRERELALHLAQAFLPSEEPWMDGYRVAGRFRASSEPGGGFYDFTRLGASPAFFVCDVSGQGVPASLIGATARAYLRTALQSSASLADALKWVNRELHRDVERGIFVTALVVVLHPLDHVAEVACAGHKLPLLRFDAAENRLKSLQPAGFALGFDEGSVFEKRLEVIRVPMLPGDRLVLAGQGIASVCRSDGNEWGETGLYRALQANAARSAEAMADAVLNAVDRFAENQLQPNDYSLVVLARDPA